MDEHWSGKKESKISTMFWLMCLIFLIIVSQNEANAQAMKNDNHYRLKITVGEQVTTATLFDNVTTRDFISLLPMTIELKDYAGTEKIYNLPKKLSTQDAPAGIDPDVGDITYYAPWGNIALFYKDFGYASGLILLGKIDSNVNVFKTSGSVKATFEILQQTKPAQNEE